MKGKFTTKTIIIFAITILLSIVAVAGTVMFLNDSGESAAIDETETNLILPVAGNDESNLQEITQTESSDVVEDVEEVTANTESDINTNETENRESETAENGETTTAETTSQARDESIEQIEETVVTEEKQILDELSLSWTTITLPSITANMGVYKPELTIEKTATLVNGEPIIATTRVRPQDKITYEIKVSNIGNYKTTNVVITDSLDVIFEDQKIEAGNQIVKLDVLEPGKEATVTVIYEVTENDVATLEKILNVAYATDGRTTVQDDDDTPVINPNVEVTGEKTWEDEENKYGTRPEKITVNLLADSEVVDSIEVIADENGIWNYEFIKLPMYSKDGKVITYTIDEELVRNYTKDIDEYNIANTLTPEETVDVLVTKTWVDNDNKYNTRPSEITVNLLADGNIVETVKVTADTSGNWKYEFTDLPKHNGKQAEIVYTISEEDISDYKKEINGYNIINTLEPEETVDIAGEKIWEDNENQYSSRPSKIIVNLLIEGKVVNSQEVTADTNDDWKYEFTKLPKYDINDKEIQYSIDEEAVAYYNKKIEKYNITNTLEQEYITLRGNKKWVYPEGEASITVPTVEIVLLQNGEPYFEDSKFNAKVNKDSTGYIYPNLPKYSFTTDKNGVIQRKKNLYSVTEEQPTGWQKPIIEEVQESGNVWTQNITNVANPIYTSFDVEKVWVDEGDTNKRPTITVKLYQNGNPYKKADGSEYTKILNSGQTKYTFGNLPKYTTIKSSNGTITYQKNTYTVREVGTASGYEKPSYKDTGTKTTITNTIKQEPVSISGTKVWNTPSNTNTTNATSITIYAHRKEANGSETKTIYYDKLEYGETTYKITGLPKYKENSDGTLYINSAGNVELNQYVAHEDTNSQYIASEEGNTITNTPKVIVEEITTTIQYQQQAQALDVVMVIDISNSMKKTNSSTNNKKMQDVMNAVNPAITTIMNANPQNRVGVVAFSAKNVSGKSGKYVNVIDLLNLGRYTPKTTYESNNTTIGKYFEFNSSEDKVYTNVNETQSSAILQQGTYIQSGIARGVRMFQNAGNVTGRTPILILLTDGEPTFCDYNFDDINVNVEAGDIRILHGAGDSTSSTDVNYTVKTGKAYRTKIEEIYGTANVYTVGFSTSYYTRRTLDPSGSNDYVDEAYLDATINSTNLANKLKSFIKITETPRKTETKEIPAVNSNKVVLKNVDTSKENDSTITYGTTIYTLKTVPDDAIDKTGTTYTIYLNKLPGLTAKTQVNISYYKK